MTTSHLLHRGSGWCHSGFGFRVEMTGVARWRWLAALPSVLGFVVTLRCVWDFRWTGYWTLAPIAPPRRLVVVGFYRHVRNPMYVGFAAGWIGLWVVFGHANVAAIVALAVFALGVHLFVILYEEPTLRGKFGADYETYWQNVRRSWPRLKTLGQARAESVAQLCPFVVQTSRAQARQARA